MYIDLHTDIFWAMAEYKKQFDSQSSIKHIDLPRAREGGLLGAFITGYPTTTSEDINYTLNRWLQITADGKNHLRRIKSVFDVTTLIDDFNSREINQREIGAIMHLEGAQGIQTFDQLYIYYEIGLRSLGLTWNEENQYATGQLGNSSRGLTPQGKDLLDVLESLGIIIDVSHLNDKSFWEVLANTNGPIIASHSNLRKWADHKRNLTDEMVLELSKTGGGIGINLCKGFLSVDQTKHPANRHCAQEMIKEVVHLIGGYDSVMMGTDFDGCTIVEDIQDVSYMPNFLEELQNDLSCSTDQLNNIAYNNIIRIMSKIWK